MLLHWFGPLKYYSYMLLEQVFTLTVFTGDFVLIFKVVIKNGKLGHKGLEIGLEYFTSHMVG